MINQNIHIIEFKALYNILEEIKENLKFKILYYPKNEIFFKFLNSDQPNLDSSIILVKNDNKKIFNNLDLNKNLILSFDTFPIEIHKLIETINIHLIKKKYKNQSKIIIKNYIINLNSRLIMNDETKLKLTEREIDIILFLNSHKKPQKIDILQNEVWGYSLETETHTVETHIYRLRKKIKNIFNDENFIKSNKTGYSIE